MACFTGVAIVTQSFGSPTGANRTFGVPGLALGAGHSPLHPLLQSWCLHPLLARWPGQPSSGNFAQGSITPDMPGHPGSSWPLAFTVMMACASRAAITTSRAMRRCPGVRNRMRPWCTAGTSSFAMTFRVGRCQGQTACQSNGVDTNGDSDTSASSTSAGEGLVKKEEIADIQRTEVWNMPKDVLKITGSQRVRFKSADKHWHERDLVVIKGNNAKTILERSRKLISAGSTKQSKISTMMSIGRSNWNKDIVTERTRGGLRAFRYRSGQIDMRNDLKNKRREKRLPDNKRKRHRWSDGRKKKVVLTHYANHGKYVKYKMK